MWSQMQKLLNGGAGGASSPVVVPLRRTPPFDSLQVGKVVRFAASCPLKPLTSAHATVIAVRYYRFGDDMMKSYQLQVGEHKNYHLTVAEDDQGQYLSLSRALNDSEQDRWFGRDALSFFTEPSSARSIRCKADLMIDGDWAAARYSKTVDWVEGSVAPAEAARLARAFHYNLLVNETGDKALEIEHDDTNGENRIFVTVYRPTEDIAGIEDTLPEEAPVAEAAPEVPLFKEPALSSGMPKQRHDFRRLEEPNTPIHIERTEPVANGKDDGPPDLPAFLLSRPDDYLSLDQVIPPESERVRVNVNAALVLISRAIHKNVRVRDVLRDMLGLESALSDEVVFELPLSDNDYRTLAMRYKLRPDHRVEIRSRLEEELKQKLSAIAKG